ncbi:hypothetical protein [Streptomyces sp. NPDC004788]
MTDRDPMQDALAEAATSLMRTLGFILLVIIGSIVLLAIPGMLFLVLGGTVDH